MKKNCAVSGKEFEVTQEDLKFYEKMGVPAPTLCPEERRRRRLSWQNMRNLYHRTCDITGKKILSNYSSEKDMVVYEQAFWWSDKWDFRDFGLDFDFSKTFFENYKILMGEAPIPNLFTSYLSDENSKFTNFAGYDKNCYLIFHADFNEDCYFGVGIKKCKDMVDGLNVFGSELIYECIDVRNCYDLKFSQDCENCSDSWFLKDCIGCKNCFGCMNLNHKEYYLFNKKVSKAEYKKFIKDFKSDSFEVLKKLNQQFIDFQKTQPQKYFQGFQNENCTGSHIFRSQNCKECFDVQESRDMKFCQRIYNGPNSDCYDVDQFGARIERIYESGPIGLDCQNSAFAMLCYSIVDVYYTQNSFNSNNCFGCFGVKNTEYCILNKQYLKEEYFILRDKIIEHMKKTGEWGEFFPMELSPFGYNETVAMEYFPLDEPKLSSPGLENTQGFKPGLDNFKYNWKPEEVSAKYSGPKVEIPDDIKDVEDNICEKILTCEVSGKNYRIVKPELAFYRKMNLPIPKVCPDVRHEKRMELKNPNKLWERKCDNDHCENIFKTTFDSEREEKVFCEKCYEGVVN